MKFFSLLCMIESACLVLKELDSKGWDDKARATELGTSEHGIGEILGSSVAREVVTGVEALIDTSEVEEDTSESAASVAQTVQ